MQLGRPVVRRGLIASAALAVILTACNDDGREMRPPVLPPPPTTTTPPNTVPAGEGSQGAIITAPSTSTLPASFQLVTAWPNGAQIPARYTCDDANVAPAISWTAVPVDAVEIAVSMVDLDANFVHWVMSRSLVTQMRSERSHARPRGDSTRGRATGSPDCSSSRRCRSSAGSGRGNAMATRAPRGRPPPRQGSP